MRPREVFVSHSHVDRVFARRLCAALQEHGIKTWFAPQRIVGSQRWHDEIGRALGRCDWFILVLSPSAVASKWVKHELLFTLNEDRYEDRIVPLLLRNCRFKKLSWTLAQLQRVDFRHGFETGMSDLRKCGASVPHDRPCTQRRRKTANQPPSRTEATGKVSCWRTRSARPGATAATTCSFSSDSMLQVE